MQNTRGFGDQVTHGTVGRLSTSDNIIQKSTHASTHNHNQSDTQISTDTYKELEKRRNRPMVKGTDEWADIWIGMALS